MQLKPGIKELSFCHKLWFSNPKTFQPDVVRPLIFQTVNSVRSKWSKFEVLGCKDIRISKGDGGDVLFDVHADLIREFFSKNKIKLDTYNLELPLMTFNDLDQ